MGGDGSGRRPSAETILGLNQPRELIKFESPSNEIILPNYSGLQAVKLTDPAISSGGGGNNFWTSGGTALYPVDGSKGISGSQIWVGPNPVLTSYTETDPVWLSQSGSYYLASNPSGYISSYTETDPVWLSMSGSYLKTADLASSETDPKFISLSGSLSYLPMSLSGSTSQPNNSVIFVSGSNLYGQANLLSFSGSNVGIGTTTPLAPLHINRSSVTVGGSTGNIFSYDTTALAANVGGGIVFGGQFTTAPLYAEWGYIKSLKENAVDGEYGAHLSFATRTHGSNTTERMRLTSTGDLQLSETANNTPTITLSGGMFVSGGGLWYKGFSGTYTQVAVA